MHAAHTFLSLEGWNKVYKPQAYYIQCASRLTPDTAFLIALGMSRFVDVNHITNHLVLSFAR
jgi:hypothetical protein